MLLTFCCKACCGLRESGCCTPGAGGVGDVDQLEFWLSHWKLSFPVWRVELSEQEYFVELKHRVYRWRRKKGLGNGTGKSDRTCMMEGEETLIYPQNFKYSDEDKTGLSPAAVSRTVLLLMEAVSLVCCRGRCKQVTGADSVPSTLFFPWPQTNLCLIWIPSYTLERRRQDGIVFGLFDNHLQIRFLKEKVRKIQGDGICLEKRGSQSSVGDNCLSVWSGSPCSSCCSGTRPFSSERWKWQNKNLHKIMM